MLNRKIITGASLIVIFFSICGMLKIIFDVSQSAPATSVATAATPVKSILPISTSSGRVVNAQSGSTRSTPISPPAFTQATPRASATSGPEVSGKPELAAVTPVETPAGTPLKSRIVKHQPSQFRSGALSKAELAAIKKAIRTISWSRNPDPKAAADEDYAAIVKACESSTVHDLLADLITEAASNDYRSDSAAANNIYSNQLILNFETRAKDQGQPQKHRSPR